jgi:thiosulfate/3-mercaptopyruvate sulfurtransferase
MGGGQPSARTSPLAVAAASWEAPVMDALVSTSWLADQLGHADLRILDCTVLLAPQPAGGYAVESGRAAWERAHIPGSAFVDLPADLSDPHSPLRFTLPTPERFAAAMGALGVGDGHRVVLYDSRVNMWAARLWWMLRAFGFDDAAVLDGGWRAWTTDGRPTSTAAPDWPAATFTARPRPDLFVGKDAVRAAVGGGRTCLVNALDRAQHRGEVQHYGRPGHIAGSANVPAAELVDEATHRYRPLDELRDTFADVAGRGDRVITYCGGGIAASSDAFVLHLLGHDDVAVYDGSLSEWAADPSLPMEI